MELPVLIFGATGLGKVALEIFERNGVTVYGFLDDDPATHGRQIGEVSVLGRTDDDGFLKLIGRKCEAFVAVDEPALRKGLLKLLLDRRHVMPVNAIHPQAVLAASATLGHGTLVGPGAVVGAFARLGHHNLLHARALVDYEAHLADHVQVGAGATVGSGAHLEAHVFVGSGAVVVPGVKVGKGARVGAGSVVVGNVAAGATVFGNPAQPVTR